MNSLKLKNTQEKEVKKLFYNLYRIFPNGRTSGELIDDIIKTEEDREALVKYGYLIEENTDKGKWYGLGPNGLQLIISWNMEKLTKEMAIIAVLTTILAVINVFLLLR